MYFPFKKKSGSTGSQNIILAKRGTSPDFVDLTGYTTDGKLLTVYKAVKGDSVTWLYAGGSTCPHFRFAIPSDVAAGSSKCLFKGYTPKASFYNTATNDKCICTATNYVCVSDFSFNGDLDAWGDYVKDLYIYLPFDSIKNVDYT